MHRLRTKPHSSHELYDLPYLAAAARPAMSLEGEGRGGKSMGSLDNLISFLLDEVALCGENGEGLSTDYDFAWIRFCFIVPRL